MKRLLFFVVLSFFAIGMICHEGYAFEGSSLHSTQQNSDWLAAEMPLKTWLGISESERIKIARGFVDDYYQMDKTCDYAKIKAFYDEKKNLTSIYVECLKRSQPKLQDKKAPQGA